VSDIPSEGEVLTEVFKSTGGADWKILRGEAQIWSALGTNGTAGVCEDGKILGGRVSCDFQRRVKFLDLSNVEATGEVPEDLVYLKGLRRLNLSHNGLTGTVPESFGLVRNLLLNVDGNYLTGTIPEGACPINDLVVPPVLNCRKVACPVNTWRATRKNECEDCAEGKRSFLGASECVFINDDASLYIADDDGGGFGTASHEDDGAGAISQLGVSVVDSTNVPTPTTHPSSPPSWEVRATAKPSQYLRETPKPTTHPSSPPSWEVRTTTKPTQYLRETPKQTLTDDPASNDPIINHLEPTQPMAPSGSSVATSGSSFEFYVPVFLSVAGMLALMFIVLVVFVVHLKISGLDSSGMVRDADISSHGSEHYEWVGEDTHGHNGMNGGWERWKVSSVGERRVSEEGQNDVEVNEIRMRRSLSRGSLSRGSRSRGSPRDLNVFRQEAAWSGHNHVSHDCDDDDPSSSECSEVGDFGELGSHDNRLLNFLGSEPGDNNDTAISAYREDNADVRNAIGEASVTSTDTTVSDVTEATALWSDGEGAGESVDETVLIKQGEVLAGENGDASLEGAISVERGESLEGAMSVERGEL